MEFYSYIFDAFGKSFKIFGNWAPCLKDICDWYPLPKSVTSLEPELTLEISAADAAEINKRIPLPGGEYKIKSGIITANQDFNFTTYSKKELQWIDYKDLGRIMIDYKTGQACSLLCGDAMLATYQKYLFADYPLDKLFTPKEIFSMHASCAVVDGKGIAFTGDSGAGKSTAAFILMQQDMPILTDEKLYVFKKDRGYQAGSVSDIIKVNNDSFSKFFAGNNAYSEYDMIAGEHYLKISGSKTSAWKDQSPLKALCLLEQTGKPQTFITSVNPTKLAGGLFPVTITGATRQFKADKFNFITEMLNNIECRLVQFGTDMNDFAEKIGKLSETL